MFGAKENANATSQVRWFDGGSLWGIADSPYLVDNKKVWCVCLGGGLCAIDNLQWKNMPVNWIDWFWDKTGNDWRCMTLPGIYLRPFSTQDMGRCHFLTTFPTSDPNHQEYWWWILCLGNALNTKRSLVKMVPKDHKRSFFRVSGIVNRGAGAMRIRPQLPRQQAAFCRRWPRPASSIRKTCVARQSNGSFCWSIYPEYQSLFKTKIAPPKMVFPEISSSSHLFSRTRWVLQGAVW